MSAQALKKAHNEFKSALIAWYDSNARTLPWRSEPSLYKTVVSEFMLQQTQVKTVLPYFAKWLARFPDFSKLAAASEADVLKHWEGLGYYSRARNLRKLAQEVAVLDIIPQDAKSWQSFPGVGPYAAAAISSIAFDTPAAVVDGNVARILARLTADATAYKNSVEASKAYRPLADDLLNASRAGDHNQAMMELGATICQKHNPQCLLCPAQTLCQGRQQGIAADLPRLAKVKAEQKTVDRAWIHEEGRFLLHRIPADAKRMRGLHEIPDLALLKLNTPRFKPIIERKRSITKYRITERFFSLESAQLAKQLPDDCLWASVKDLETLAFTGPHRRWIDELLKI